MGEIDGIDNGSWLDDENDLSGLAGNYQYDDWGVELRTRANEGEQLSDWERESVLRKNSFLAPYGREYYFDSFNPSRFYSNCDPELPIAVGDEFQEFWSDCLPEAKAEAADLIKDLIEEDRMNKYSLDLIQSQIAGHISWVLKSCLDVELDTLAMADKVANGDDISNVLGDFDLVAALDDLPEAASQVILKLAARFGSLKLVSDRLRELKGHEQYGFVSSLEDFAWRYPESDLDSALADYYLLIGFFTDSPDRYIYDEFKTIPKDKYVFASSFAIEHPFRVQFQKVVNLPSRLIRIGQRQDGIESLYYALNTRADSSRWDEAFAFSQQLTYCMERYDPYYSERGLEECQAHKPLIEFMASINEKFDAPVLRLGSFLMEHPLFFTKQELAQRESFVYLHRFYDEISYVEGADWESVNPCDLLKHPYTRTMGKLLGRQVEGLVHVINDLDPDSIHDLVTYGDQDLSKVGSDEYQAAVMISIEELLEDSGLVMDEGEMFMVTALLTAISYDYACQNLGLRVESWQNLISARESELSSALRVYQRRSEVMDDIKDVLSYNGGVSVYLNAIDSGEISSDDYSPLYVIMAVLEAYGIHIPYEIVEMAHKSVMSKTSE